MGKVLKTHQKSTKKRSTTNRFRFAAFSTRIDAISIDSLRRVAGSFKGDSVRAGTTWFERACQEWREVNVTTAYAAFYQEVRPWLGSAVSIVFYQQEIVKTLQKYLLDKKHALAWKPVANLVAMLCKDLADDFYVHLLPLLDALLAVSSSSQEEDVVEAAFCSVMFLVKTQFSSILGDFGTVYGHLAAVAHKRSPLAPFCAQAVGYLLRKSPSPEQLLPAMIGSQNVAFVTEAIKEAVLEPRADAAKFRPNTKVIVTRALESDALALHLMPTLVTCTKHNGPIWKIATDRLPHSNALLAVMLAVRKGLMCPAVEPIIASPGADARTLALALRIAPLEVVLRHRASLAARVSPLLVLWMHSLDALDRLQPVMGGFRIADASPLSLAVAAALSLPVEGAVAKVDVDRYSPGLEQSHISAADWTGLFAWPAEEIDAHKALWLTLLTRSKLIDGNLQRVRPFLDQPCVLEQCSSVEVPLSNLSHPDARVREHSLRLMSQAASPLVEKMVQIESTPADLAQYRRRLLHIRELAAMSGVDEEVRMRFLLGQLHVKFALVIPETMAALHGLAQKQPSLFAKVFLEEYARMSRSVGAALPHDAEKTPSAPPFSFDDEGLRHMGSLSHSIEKAAAEGPRLALVTPAVIQPSNWVPLLKLLAAHAFAKVPVGELFVEQYDGTGCSADFAKVNQSNLSAWFSALSRAASSVPTAAIDVLLGFVGIGDARLQLGAIDALVAVDKATGAVLSRPVTSDPKGPRWIDRIRALLQDEAQCRECLLVMSMEPATPTPDVLHGILARVFYGRLVKGRSAADPVARRRKLIFAAMTAGSAPWQRPTFAAFLAHMLQHQGSDEEKTGVAFLTAAEPLIARGMHMIGDLAPLVDRIVSLAAGASKRMRQLGWQRILQLLQQDADRMHPSFARIWTELLLPRLDSFEDDMAHAPKSAMMDALLHAVEHVQEAFYSSDAHRLALWSRVVALLGKASTASRAVLGKTLRFVDHAIAGERFPVTDALVEALSRCITDGALVEDKRLLAHLVHVICRCRLHANGNMAAALCPLLSLPNAACPEAVKTQVLQALHSAASEDIAEPVVGLLRTMRSAEGRQAAAAFFMAVDADLGVLLAALESFTTVASSERVAETEPDYEARQRAIAMIPAYLGAATSPLLWRAVLASLLFQVSLEDLSLRSHAHAAVVSLLGKSELVDRAIMDAVRACFKSARTSESVRSDHLALLQRLIQSSPERYAQMLPLAEIGGSSEEASFFLNIYHIQKHRRGRAMRRLAEMLEMEGHVSKSLLQDILIPLLMPFVIRRDGAEPLDGALQQDALNTLGVLFARLPPTALAFKVRKLLREHVTAEKKSPQAQRAVIKLVTLTVQHLRAADGALLELLLPLWNDDDAKTMETRIPLAVAVARLAPDSEPLVRGLLAKLAMTLKRGLPPVRNACLSALQQIASHLGAARLPLVMDVLLGVVDDAGRQAANSGYQKHIMLHAINACICKSSDIPFGASRALLDGLLWDAAIGKLAGEKENPDWTAKAHEVRTQKTYDAIERLLLSMSVAELTAVVDQMIDANPCSPEAMQRLLNVVFNAAVHAIKAGGACAELWLLVETAERADALLGMKIMSFAAKSGCFADSPDVPIEHALGAIPRASAAVAECALVALNSLVTRSGPWNARLLALAFSKLADHTVPCLRLLSTLVTRDGLQLDETQMRCILQLTRACMDASESDDGGNVGICFALIRSMISKKVLLLDIFDLVHAAVALAVTSSRAAMRDQCRRLVLQFLLEYPIGDAKFVQVVSSLLNNLRYEVADGRLSCAELLAAIVQRNPRPGCIDTGKWLLALVERMANEPHDACLAAERELARLLARAAPSAMDECLDTAGRWLAREAMRPAAWGLLRFAGLGFIEAGHAKRLLSFCAVPFDCPEAVSALTDWCRADAQFLEIARRQPLAVSDASLALLSLLVAADPSSVDVAQLVRAVDSTADSALLAQTIFAADPAPVHLVKVNNLARRSQSESALQAALCMSLLHLRKDGGCPVDDASALSIIALVHFLQSEPRSDTVTDGCTRIDAMLRTGIEPTRLAALLAAHSRTSAGKKARREAALVAMRVEDPQGYAARKLGRNRSKRSSGRKGGQARAERRPKRAREDPLEDLF